MPNSTTEKKHLKQLETIYDCMIREGAECKALLAEHSFEERTNISLKDCSALTTGGGCTAFEIPSSVEGLCYWTAGDSSADLKNEDLAIEVMITSSKWIFLDEILDEIRWGDSTHFGLTKDDLTAFPSSIDEMINFIIKTEKKLKDAKLPIKAPEPQIKTFTAEVKVMRTEYATVTVEAISEKEARCKAEALIQGQGFSFPYNSKSRSEPKFKNVIRHIWQDEESDKENDNA